MHFIQFYSILGTGHKVWTPQAGGEFGTTKTFRGILWGHEIFWEILWGHEIFWSVKTLRHILFLYYCTVLLLFFAYPFSLSKISISLQYRFSHLYWNLLLVGLSFEKKTSTLTLIWATFHDFSISRFWDMASSWKGLFSYFWYWNVWNT